MKRIYEEALMRENEIAKDINKRQELIGAVITIDYIERYNPTSAVDKIRRVVYHYDKED